MILTCPKCATKLKLESEAMPATAFNVSCPKCQVIIPVTPPSLATPAQTTNIAPPAPPAPPVPPPVQTRPGNPSAAGPSFATQLAPSAATTPVASARPDDFSTRLGNPGFDRPAAKDDFSTRIAPAAALTNAGLSLSTNVQSTPAASSGQAPAPAIRESAALPPPASVTAQPPSAPLPNEQGQDSMMAFVSMLASALSQFNPHNHTGTLGASPEEFARRRSVLVCLGNRDSIAEIQSVLRPHEYALMIVETIEQAIELLQLSQKVDIVLLSPEFQVDAQGSTAILRFIGALGPERRRRLFLTMISNNSRTGDERGAFNQGVNLLVSSHDLQMLPLALTKGIRDLNALYRTFNEASGLNPF